MLARDQLLRQPLADFRRRCIVTADQLGLDPGRQVFLMLLQVEVEPLLALVAGLRDKPCIAVDQPILTVCAASGAGKLATATSRTINLRYIATLPILAVTLPRRAPTDGRILPQKVRISAQRKARIRANITATEKIAIEPNLAHLTQAYLARPNDNAPTLTNKGTASAWRIATSDRPATQSPRIFGWSFTPGTTGIRQSAFSPAADLSQLLARYTELMLTLPPDLLTAMALSFLHRRSG